MDIKGTVEQWERIEKSLVEEGWNIQVRLMWVAEARRGREFEQGIGLTRDEAFDQLKELTRMDAMIGLP